MLDLPFTSNFEPKEEKKVLFLQVILNNTALVLGIDQCVYSWLPCNIAASIFVITLFG